MWCELVLRCSKHAGVLSALPSCSAVDILDALPSGRSIAMMGYSE